MIRKVGCLIISLLVSHLALSQTDYRPGYIITLSKDTVEGFILYTTSEVKFTTCSFRKTLSDEVTIFTPTQINGYRLKNDSYFSVRSVKIDTEINQLYFAEILVLGKATLFRIFDKFYLEDSQLKVYPLEQTITEIIEEDKRYKKNDYKYVGILNWQFADCPKAQRQVKGVGLKERDLTILFEQYNSCFDQKQTSFKGEKPWSQTYIGLSGGAMITQILNIDDFPLSRSMNADQFKKDKGLFIGLSYSFSSPRISERFSLNIDLFYQKASHESIVSTSETYDVVFFGYTSLRLPLSVSYHFVNSRNNLKPFVEGGISLAFYLTNESYWQHEEIDANSVTIDRLDDIIVVESNTARPFLGLGLSYDLNERFRASIRTQYQYGLSAIDNGLSPITEQSISFSGNIQFKLSK